MKTSNKIILALFSLPLVLMIFIYGSLYAKYKSNDFITEKQLREETLTRTALQAFSVIDLSEYRGGHVEIQQGASYELSFNTWNKDNFSVDNTAAVLRIKSNNDHHNELTITCPSFTQLIADSVYISMDSFKLGTLDCKLGTNLTMALGASVDSLTVQLKRNSKLELINNANIGLLNIEVENKSTLEQSGGSINQLGHVLLGDSSSVELDGKTLQNLLKKAP